MYLEFMPPKTVLFHKSLIFIIGKELRLHLLKKIVYLFTAYLFIVFAGVEVKGGGILPNEERWRVVVF